MGWCIDVETDRPLTDEVVESVIADLPDGLIDPYGMGGPSRQSWGWAIACDVRLTEGLLTLSGSYGMSGNIARYAAEAFARRLEKRGYRVSIGELA